MASASFGMSDTSGPPYGLGAVTASMTGHKWMFWDAKYTDFLRFCVAVHVPTQKRCLPIHHIPHRTHKAGKHFQTVWPLAPAVGSRLFDFPGTTVPPPDGEGAHKRDWPPIPLSQDGFLRDAILFFKSIKLPAPQRALFFCISMIRQGAPKVNNQF